MWHVSSRSGVATSRTAIHLLLTYLLTYLLILCLIIDKTVSANRINGAGGIMFSGSPSVCACVRTCSHGRTLRPVCRRPLVSSYFIQHTFNGPFSATTQVSQYQKGKTNPDFTEARDTELQWHHLGHMQTCTSPPTDNHASTPPLSFLQARCPSCRPTNSVRARKTLSSFFVVN